jgi:hypothetical protein
MAGRRISRRSYWIPGSYAATLSENHDSFLRLLKDNDFKEERMTKVRLYAISTSTTLEANKSHPQYSTMPSPVPHPLESGLEVRVLVLQADQTRNQFIN